MIKAAKIFLQFYLRDWFVHLKNSKDYIISYAIFLPLAYSYGFGYIVPHSIFSTTGLPPSFVLIGSFTVLFIVNTVPINLDFLMDLQSDRYIEYQMSLLRPRWILLERILFSTSITSCIILIFFVMCKIFLGSFLSLENLSIAKLLTIIVTGCLWSSSYIVMSYCIMGSTTYISSWYRRCNFPMIVFGGLWMQWSTMYSFSPLVGYIGLCNPLIYISEALRSSVFGPAGFIPFWICISILLTLSVLFYTVSIVAFKRLVDHT